MSDPATKSYLEQLAELSVKNNRIEPEMYTVHDVKRGLRDVNGNGVVTGLTEVSVVNWKRKDENGVEHLIDGELFYRGIRINDIVDGFIPLRNERNKRLFENFIFKLLSLLLYFHHYTSAKIKMQDIS